VSDHDDERDLDEPGDGDLLEEQEGKGYGEDEGERDAAFEDDDDQ
jgi:hypothetical protein